MPTTQAAAGVSLWYVTVFSRMLKNSSSARLLKKVQMQGGARWAE